ncbi:MAG: glutathione S-transferase [Myxococcota bacterium]
MPKVTLYTFATSPYGLKVQAYLAYKRIPHDIVYVDPFHPRRTLPVGRIVPVLRIDRESRNESQDIARWLDERFPERPLFPPAGESCVTELDDWVQHCMIPALFKFARPGFSPALPVQVVNAWRLGRSMDRTVPDGAIGWRRVFWPLVLRMAPFMRREAARAPGTNLSDTARRIARRLERELSPGPFLCGRDTVSVADLSTYGPIALGYELGLSGGDGLLRRQRVRDWARRVHTELDPALPLVPSALRVRSVG